MRSAEKLFFSFVHPCSTTTMVRSTVLEKDASTLVDCCFSEDHDTLGNAVMNERRRTCDHETIFNDVSFYLNLKETYNTVEIASLRILHNAYCQGIRVKYRVLFPDGRMGFKTGPEHRFSYGYFAYQGGPSRYTMVQLEDKEYIQGIRVNHGEILDGIYITTNLRQVHIGGDGGGDPTDIVKVHSNRKVVAFAGTVDGVWQRLGCYSVHCGWETRGPYVMLRKLVKDSRAQSRGRTMLRKKSVGHKWKTKASKLIIALVENVDVFHEDVFRHVMTFL